MSAIDDLKDTMNRESLLYPFDRLQTTAILAIAARLDEAEKRITELELASPCPMLKSICEDWEYTGKLDGTERIKIPISQPKFGPLLNDAKPSPEYCTCGETETWFDRSMTTDEQGNVIQDMCDRCVKCGKEKKYVPEPDDAEPAPDREMVEPPEFHDFCERVFEPGTDYRTGDIRMLLREHIKELREIVARWDAGV